MIQVQEVFGISLPLVLTIDRSKTFKEMFITADRRKGCLSMAWPIHDVVRDAYDLHLRHKVETVTLHGFTNERGMITTTVLEELDALGYVPASIIHWLAFGSLCPDSLNKDPEVSAQALGGRYMSPRLERSIANGITPESTLDTPYIYYWTYVGRGSFLKGLDERWVHNRSRWKAFKHVFLAVAKEGQG